MASVIKEDLTVRGNLSCDTFSPPDNCIGTDAINVNSPIETNKQKHQYNVVYSNGKHGVAAAGERRVVHVANGAGLIEGVDIGAVVANIGAAVVTFNLYKNGATVLSAPVDLTSATAAFALVSPGIATYAYVADDVFEVFISVAAGGGTLAQAFFARLVFNEEQVG